MCMSRALLGVLDMEVLLHSTLAGGVVMGAACDFIVEPGSAMIAGGIAGLISAACYLKANSVFKE